MWKFLKYTFATFIGTTLGLTLFFIFGIAAIVGIATVSISGSDVEQIKEPSILVINLREPVVERALHNPLKDLDYASLRSEVKLGLTDIIASIKKAETDINIAGIVLKVRSPQAGLSTLSEIRSALEDFKGSGKFILSYSDYQDQKGYYFSSVADRMYMEPEGTLEFKGLHAEIVFLTKTLEKLGLEPQIIRYGKYKSAIEPFTETQMSTENEEQMKVLIDNLWKQILNEISAQRAISVQDLNALAENLSISNVKKAVNKGLIDESKYYDEFLAELKDSLGTSEDKNIPAVKLSDYIALWEAEEATNTMLNENKIAVVYANGSIVPGEGQDDNMGGDRIARAIRKARTDKAVKAIILRVNSGGGSALASDIIWREMDLSSKVKPTVVSMGDYAASGGYYIACPANAIVANPTTLTGSIGVFGMLMSGQKMFENIGLTTDIVKTNSYADIGSFTRPLSAYERSVIGKEIDQIYDTFISHVAEGRERPKEIIDSIGQGRVWTGTDALDIGLVDMLGGFATALKIAEDMAEISDYSIMKLPESDDPFEQVMKLFQANAKDKVIESILGDHYHYYNATQMHKEIDGVQARLPYAIRIQ